MSFDGDEDRTVYTVVMNHEEQYSIWASRAKVPAGWREVGKRGSKAECLRYIDEAWVDMRPLSLRNQTGRNRERPVRSSPD
jgi:MbtH protein